MGLEMGLAVLIGWGIGSWLDRKLGTAPWLMILFLLFGSAAGFKALLQLSMNHQRELEARLKREASPGDGESKTTDETTT